MSKFRIAELLAAVFIITVGATFVRLLLLPVGRDIFADVLPWGINVPRFDTANLGPYTGAEQTNSYGNVRYSTPNTPLKNNVPTNATNTYALSRIVTPEELATTTAGMLVIPFNGIEYRMRYHNGSVFEFTPKSEEFPSNAAHLIALSIGPIASSTDPLGDYAETILTQFESAGGAEINSSRAQKKDAIPAYEAVVAAFPAPQNASTEYWDATIAVIFEREGIAYTLFYNERVAGPRDDTSVASQFFESKRSQIVLSLVHAISGIPPLSTLRGLAQTTSSSPHFDIFRTEVTN